MNNNLNNLSSSSSSIKAEAVVSSSSSNITANNSTAVVAVTGMDIRSVKKEEEEDEIVENHHDDDDDDKTSRRIQVLQVKKEGNSDKGTKSNSDEDDYSDWKAGNWCWVLTANKDNNNISNKTRQQLESQNNKNLNRRRCVETEDRDDGKINSDEGDEALSSAPPKEKTRRCRRLNSNTDTVSSIKQGQLMDNDDSFVASPVNHNDDDDDDDDDENNNAIKEKEHGSTNNNEHENEGCDDGYESWTEGNWCWILPLPKCDENGKSKHQPSSEVVPVTTEASNTTLTRSSRRRSSSNELNRSTKKTKSTTGCPKAQNERWNEMFQRLVAYKKKFKSASVPKIYAKDPKLGNWVSTQRRYHNNDMIGENRVDLLNSVGFVWETYETLPWDEMFQRLVRYKEEHHITIVPDRYKKDPKLGRWVSHQRTYYNKKKIPVERVRRLDSIGFVWNPLDEQWMEMYQKLMAYKKEHGSTNVPRRYMEDPQLGDWVVSQRRVYKNTKVGILSKKRMGLLNSMNFVWSAR